MGLFAKAMARIGGRRPVETDGSGYSADWCMSPRTAYATI